MIDEFHRTVILDEWLDEIAMLRKGLEHYDIDNTGLAPVRREILASLDRIRLYAESKKPGFTPLAAIRSVQPGL